MSERTITITVEELEKQNLCDCSCHKTDEISFEFIPCCQGPCEGCGKHYIRLGLHRAICPDWFVWAQKQKRAHLRRLQLYEDFRIAQNFYTEEELE